MSFKVYLANDDCYGKTVSLNVSTIEKAAEIILIFTKHIVYIEKA